jgi:hypothetical protein
MSFVAKMAIAILATKSVNVNMSITTKSLSVNDLLESIEFLTRSIIARKHKKFKGVCDSKNFNTRTGGWGKCYVFCSRPPLQKTLPPKNLWLEPHPPRSRSDRKPFPTLRRASLCARKFGQKVFGFGCGVSFKIS